MKIQTLENYPIIFCAFNSRENFTNFLWLKKSLKIFSAYEYEGFQDIKDFKEALSEV